MTGEKCYRIKKCFSLELCKNKGNKKSRKQAIKKAEKSEKKKIGKMKTNSS